MALTAEPLERWSLAPQMARQHHDCDGERHPEHDHPNSTAGQRNR